MGEFAVEVQGAVQVPDGTLEIAFPYEDIGPRPVCMGIAAIQFYGPIQVLLGAVEVTPCLAGEASIQECRRVLGVEPQSRTARL